MSSFRTALLATLSAAMSGALCGPAFAADAVPNYVSAAVADVARPPADMEKDALRKPASVIALSLAKPGDKIVDLIPQPGYYTRILSKVVGPRGAVYAIVPYVGPNPQVIREQLKGATRKPGSVEAALVILEDTADYKNDTVLWENLAQYGGHMSAPEQVDVVWSADTYHDLHNVQFGKIDLAKINAAIFAALKPGGVFLVLDHAGAAGTGFTQTETLHRAEADAVKNEILAAGFTLDAQSNVAVNAGDDHTKNSRDVGDAVDRFVLRFKKPASAKGDHRPGTHAMDGYYGNTDIGLVGSEMQRWVFYHPDGTYQEFGNTGTRLQEGTWYWDAFGHNCMLHQYPADERGFIVCHATAPNKKVGETWMEDNGGGARPFKLIKGYDLTGLKPGAN